MTKKVWVVEDDPGIREVILMWLSEEGYEVCLFENATQFKTALKTQSDKMDAMLLDVMLPDGNGLQLCQMVKSDPNYTQVPVLMMSAGMSYVDVERFCRADAFIPKPFDLNDMFGKLNRLIGARVN